MLSSDMSTSLQSQMSDSGNSSSAAGKSTSSLQDSFLTMLTAELKNQDPTNPMDSTQMVSQLSQLSTSQGINDLKKLTQSEVLALLGSQRLASSQLVGKNVAYKISDLNVNKNHQSFEGYLQTDSTTSGDMTVRITNSDGTVVKTVNVSRAEDGKYHWKWDGKDIHGHSVAAGQYSIEAVNKDGDGSVPIIMDNTVSKIEFMPNGSTELIFNDQSKAMIQDVVSIGDGK